MKGDRPNKNFEFISAKRKCLEDEFRRVFEREDFNIDRLTSHAEQVTNQRSLGKVLAGEVRGQGEAYWRTTGQAQFAKRYAGW